MLYSPKFLMLKAKSHLSCVVSVEYILYLLGLEENSELYTNLIHQMSKVSNVFDHYMFPCNENKVYGAANL